MGTPWKLLSMAISGLFIITAVVMGVIYSPGDSDAWTLAISACVLSGVALLFAAQAPKQSTTVAADGRKRTSKVGLSPFAGPLNAGAFLCLLEIAVTPAVSRLVVYSVVGLTLVMAVSAACVAKKTYRLTFKWVGVGVLAASMVLGIGSAVITAAPTPEPPPPSVATALPAYNDGKPAEIVIRNAAIDQALAGDGANVAAPPVLNDGKGPITSWGNYAQRVDQLSPQQRTNVINNMQTWHNTVYNLHPNDPVLWFPNWADVDKSLRHLPGEYRVILKLNSTMSDQQARDAVRAAGSAPGVDPNTLVVVSSNDAVINTMCGGGDCNSNPGPAQQFVDASSQVRVVLTAPAVDKGYSAQANTEAARQGIGLATECGNGFLGTVPVPQAIRAQVPIGRGPIIPTGGGKPPRVIITTVVITTTQKPPECKPGIPVGSPQCATTPSSTQPSTPPPPSSTTTVPPSSTTSTTTSSTTTTTTTKECKPGIPEGDKRCEETTTTHPTTTTTTPPKECKPGIPEGDDRCKETTTTSATTTSETPEPCPPLKDGTVPPKNEDGTCPKDHEEEPHEQGNDRPGHGGDNDTPDPEPSEPAGGEPTTLYTPPPAPEPTTVTRPTEAIPTNSGPPSESPVTAPVTNDPNNGCDPAICDGPGVIGNGDGASAAADAAAQADANAAAQANADAAAQEQARQQSTQEPVPVPETTVERPAAVQTSTVENMDLNAETTPMFSARALFVTFMVFLVVVGLVAGGALLSRREPQNAPRHKDR